MTDQENGAAQVPEKKIFAAIFAHPDDADFTCSGSVAKWIDEGHEVHYVILTNGDKGTADPEMTSERLIATREKEQLEAAKILGVKSVIFLRHPDGMLVADLDLRKKIVRVLRQLRPTAIICGDPTMYWFGPGYINHPDHRAAAEAVLSAMYPASGNRNYYPELLDEGLEPHKIPELYISGTDKANLFIDISGTIDRKIAALKAHVSQLGDWDVEGPIKEWAEKDGQRADPPVPYAEDFLYMTPEG